jgi:hypothetical protein
MATEKAVGGDAFSNIRTFLQYVQGLPVAGGSLPPAITEDLREMERRVQRIQALTGIANPVELSPFVVELLQARGRRSAVAGLAVSKAASA